MNIVAQFATEHAMLDGEAYRAHFADDPAYQLASPVDAPRLANSAVLLEALADLEQEFRTILAQYESRSD